MDFAEQPPLLARKAYDQPSVFTAANLLREARRQKGLEAGTVPALCVLDLDGDLLDDLRAHGYAQLHPTWACYHTRLYTVTRDKWTFGVIGRVVGAPFAVLVAEELFASGCQLLVSITSAGQLLAVDRPSCHVPDGHTAREKQRGCQARRGDGTTGDT